MTTLCRCCGSPNRRVTMKLRAWCRTRGRTRLRTFMSCCSIKPRSMNSKKITRSMCSTCISISLIRKYLAGGVGVYINGGSDRRRMGLDLYGSVATRWASTFVSFCSSKPRSVNSEKLPGRRLGCVYRYRQYASILRVLWEFISVVVVVAAGRTWTCE